MFVWGVHQAFGVDFKRDFNGTLFRFPLRTAAQAAVSRISHKGHAPAEAAALLRDFADEASSMLLFLKAVERVEVREQMKRIRAATRAAINNNNNAVPTLVC